MQRAMPGVVYQHIDASEFLKHVVCHFLDSRVIRHVKGIGCGGSPGCLDFGGDGI